jgi:hypothetical protein
MKVLIFKVVQDCFLPVPFSVFLRRDDQLHVSKGCEKQVTDWCRQSIRFLKETDSLMKQPIKVIPAKDIPKDLHYENDQPVTGSFTDKVDNRSMASKRKKVRSK